MAHTSRTPEPVPTGVYVGADGHVHFNDPESERFWNDTYRLGERLLAETDSGELSDALLHAEELA